MAPFQENLLLAFYGDDFTGSTDVMEALSLAGLETVLFLNPPDPDQLGAFPNIRAFGVAGGSRAFSPSEMQEKVTPALLALKESGAPLIHYKICSTCDSSPHIGSIGKIIDIVFETFHPPFIPVVAAAPVLGRYCVFGNTFARSGLDSEPYRLDRHPTMSRHPITPMKESDLRLILADQTRRSVGLFDILSLEKSSPERLFEIQQKPDIVVFDALREEHLPVIGSILWKQTNKTKPLFVIGSSGIEYALTAYWHQSQSPFVPHLQGLDAKPRIPPTDRLITVSGSCSPVTSRQIDQAVANGFREVAIDTPCLANPSSQEAEMERVLLEGLRWFEQGRNVILHACQGPDDPRIHRTLDVLRAQSWKEEDIRLRSGRLLGPLLGRILDRFISETRVDRAAVTGGDTSSYIARELGIVTLEFVAPTSPGSPLCRAQAPGRAADGIEIVFKGGQVGHPDWFLRLLNQPES